MGAGLFTNDLFNGEALGGPLVESDRGIFRANLFDAQPLGQTTPGAGGKTATQTPSDKGGGSSGGKTATQTPSDKERGSAVPVLPADAQAMPVAEGGEFPWLPVALVGGGLVLTVGAILLLSGKKSAPVTSNKRRRHRRR